MLLLLLLLPRASSSPTAATFRSRTGLPRTVRGEYRATQSAMIMFIDDGHTLTGIIYMYQAPSIIAMHPGARRDSRDLSILGVDSHPQNDRQIGNSS